MKIGYLVIFHNSENEVIPVLKSIYKNMNTFDELLIINDGSHDKTDKNVSLWLSRYKSEQIHYRIEDDLHELKCIGIGMKHFENRLIDILVHIQGDMLLSLNTRRTLEGYWNCVEDFGVASFRIGARSENLQSLDQLSSIESHWGHGEGFASESSSIACIEAPLVIRGPLLYSKSLLEVIGYQVDENLLPHSLDDLDMSLTATENNLKNFLITIPFRSDLPWGSTRKKMRSDLTPVNTVADANFKYLRKKWGENLVSMSRKEFGVTASLSVRNDVTWRLKRGVWVNRQLRNLNEKPNSITRRILAKLAWYVSKFDLYLESSIYILGASLIQKLMENKIFYKLLGGRPKSG